MALILVLIKLKYILNAKDPNYTYQFILPLLFPKPVKINLV